MNDDKCYCIKCNTKIEENKKEKDEYPTKKWSNTEIDKRFIEKLDKLKLNLDFDKLNKHKVVCFLNVYNGKGVILDILESCQKV